MHRRNYVGLGVLAAVLVLIAVSSGGVAVAQSTNQTANASANQTVASVEIDSGNKTTAKTVVIGKVRLPKGGFVAVHDGAYAQGGLLRQSLVTVSKHLSPGVHKNVTIPVKRGVPGLKNSTRLNFTQANLSAVAYRDTNNNTHYDYALSYGSKDKPYETKKGGTVADTEAVVIESNVKRVNQRSKPDPVKIRFTDQQLRHVDGHPVLTIRNATLPKGGFVVVHDKRYLGKARDSLNSAIGLSSYLKPGVHRNVTVRLINGSVNQTQTLVAVPYLDTDGDRAYDYVATSGDTDYAYVEQQNNSTVIVNDTATISVVGDSDSTTTTTTTTLDTATPFRITNLSVSNQSIHVNDELTVTVWIENPTKTRLQSEITLATAGRAVDSKEVALFPRERRAVRFTHSYSAPGKYVIKISNHSETVRVVPEGAPLITPTTSSADSGTNGSGTNKTGKKSNTQSGGGGMSIVSIILLVVLIGVFVGLLWVIYRLKSRV